MIKEDQVMKNLFLNLVVFIALLLNQAAAKDPADMNQQELNQYAHAEFQKSDEELNRLWQELQTLLRPEVKEKLLKSQLLWIKFRDAEAAAEAEIFSGGSMAPLMYSTSLKASTDARIEDLKAWIKNSSH